MRRTAIALCFALALSSGSAAVRGQASDAVNGPSEHRRAEVMQQLINSAGHLRGSVTRVFFKGENSHDDLACYTVRCDADSDDMISIENQGQMNSSILDRAIVRLHGDDRRAPFWLVSSKEIC